MKHSGKRDWKSFRGSFEFGNVLFVRNRPREHQVDWGAHPSHRSDQKIASLLGMQPPKKKQEPAPPQLGKILQKQFAQPIGVRRTLLHPKRKYSAAIAGCG